MKDTLAQRLKKAMTDADVTQQELADAVKVTQAAIQKLTSGKALSSKKIFQIAKYLNVSAEWLSEGIGNQTPNLERSKTVNFKKAHPVDTSVPPKSAKKIPTADLCILPIIPWHKISLFLTSLSKNEVFETMHITKKYKPGSFYLLAENDAHAPYLKQGEMAIVQPDENTMGRRVLVEMNEDFFIMEHCLLERECFLPKREGARQIDITEQLKYKIHGVIEEIITLRKG